MPIPLLAGLLSTVAPQLAQKGMDLLSGVFKGAVDQGADKMAEMIQEKTGISVHDIAENRLTQDQWDKLRQFEMEHQQQLLEVRKQMIAADLEMEKLRVEDMKSARTTQTERDKSDDWLVRRFTYLYALMITILTFSFIFGVVFFGPENADSPRWRVIDTILGFLLGVGLSAIIQFYFGSSKSSHDKNEQLMELANKKRKAGADADPAAAS